MELYTKRKRAEAMSCPYCREEHGCDNPGCEEAELKERIDRLLESREYWKSKYYKVCKQNNIPMVGLSRPTEEPK